MVVDIQNADEREVIASIEGLVRGVASSIISRLPTRIVIGVPDRESADSLAEHIRAANNGVDAYSKPPVSMP